MVFIKPTCARQKTIKPMVKQESTSKIPRETDRQGAELEAMRRMLSASAGTCSLSISICNSPAFTRLYHRETEEGNRLDRGG